MRDLERVLVAHIAAHGPIGFDEFQANALYAPPHGFYVRGGGAGRRRDFLTSPEVGPLFGAVVARWLDDRWVELGRPSPYRVVECGAGPGTLARTILAAAPACLDALSLTLVELGSVQWATHPPVATSRSDLPAPGELGAGPVVVLANELLDNLPVVLVERTSDGWAEVVVRAVGERLAEGLRPLGDEGLQWCARHLPDAPVGARAPVQAEAAWWLREALALAAGGRVAVIDYARSTADMVARPMGEWLRTYAAHGRSADPLEDPGACDITCDVALDQLAAVAAPQSVQPQADFLREHGIEALVAEGQARWERHGFDGGLEALAGRSRATEAAALLDEGGLGGFTVIEWSG